METIHVDYFWEEIAHIANEVIGEAEDYLACKFKENELVKLNSKAHGYTHIKYDQEEGEVLIYKEERLGEEDYQEYLREQHINVILDILEEIL